MKPESRDPSECCLYLLLQAGDAECLGDEAAKTWGSFGLCEVAHCGLVHSHNKTWARHEVQWCWGTQGLFCQGHPTQGSGVVRVWALPRCGHSPG